MQDSASELDTYLMQAPGISRATLNLKCALGVLTLGWLLVVAFEQLGRKSLGWIYALPAASLLIWLSQQDTLAVLLAPAVYAAGWVHANRILTELQRLAQERFAQLDAEIGSAPGADALLARGVLLAKVLERREDAVRDFESALGYPGGGQKMLNLAGVQACAGGHHALGERLFERALQAEGDPMLRVQIAKNRDSARAFAQQAKA